MAGRPPRALVALGLASAAVLVLVSASTAALPLRSSSAAHPSGVAPPIGDLPGWRQVLVDDFDRTSLGTAWGAYSGQPGGDPGGWWDPSHVVVRNGLLILQTFRDPAHGGRWVSGGVSSARGLKQVYGKYLVRFRVDAGKGVNSVLLLWPSGDRWPPEIDFAENGGTDGSRDTMTATLHAGTPADDQKVQRTVHADFTRWHTMGVEWLPRTLVFTLDGRVWATMTGSQVPSTAMEMDVQQAAGTCGDRWAPCPDASTPARVNLEVDWVVAYAPS